MDNLFARWASLGIHAPGEIHPYEDPEALLVESLVRIEEDERLLGIIVSWVARFGHLLLTRKFRFPSTRARRLFAAVVEESGTREKKLRRMIPRKRVAEPVFLYSNDLEILRKRAVDDPNPRFLRHGFILKNFPLARNKIVLPPAGAYERSAILRNRALFGTSLRSDFLTILPLVSGSSVRKVAQRLNVAPPTLELIIKDYVRSGLVEWIRKGRYSSLRWIGSPALMAA